LGNTKNKTVAFWGVTYKPGAPMSMNSLPSKLMRDLGKVTTNITICDPSLKITPYDSVEWANAIVCITPWAELKKLNFKRISKLMMKPRILFDARNYFKDMEDEIKKAGIKYIGVGR
jgi:UDPglucose 6-dehydrogenase